MSDVRDELEDISKVSGALVENLGQVTSDGFSFMLDAVRTSNKDNVPVIFDPVGAGASAFRKTCTHMIVQVGYCSVIKGNWGEISAVANSESGLMKGVDSTSSVPVSKRIDLVTQLARMKRCVIVCTGVEDIVSDGNQTAVCRVGHSLLGEITGVSGFS
jgi:hydroxyethylthiazole kinase